MGTLRALALVRLLRVSQPVDREPVVLLMGVSGSGKSTIGRLLAEHTGWPFEDADRLHTESSVAKMHAGIPLTDADRWPWLRAVADWIAQRHAAGGPGIIGCSALKRAYRDLLRTADPQLRIVYLKGDPALLRERLSHRHGHFFPAILLSAQLDDLEEPGPDEHPVTVPIGQTPERTTQAVLAALGR
jgi:carbohydrate kinase (thermoresistant glucokinase family)